MQRAVSLLSDSALSISAVATEAGFSDQSHMTRAFAHTYGVTPAVLRRLSREKRSGKLATNSQSASDWAIPPLLV
jgi:AraC-like DNA-binding protein